MYWCNRDKSRDTFVGAWTRSGDKYVCDADGYYTYAGRSDDMLKVGGIYVSPFEVEAALAQHPAVLEAAVIGVADADDLIKPKAFVVLRPGQQWHDGMAAELQAFKSRSRRTSIRARSNAWTNCRRPPLARSSVSGCASARKPHGSATEHGYRHRAIPFDGRQIDIEYQWLRAERDARAAGGLPA
jgi:acyl-CoA synthetase (AMP-forming)/AMP-acid ligase II